MGDVLNLIEQGDRLFSDRLPFMRLCQEIAENFYPERADFTVNRTLGDNYADFLTTSYPILVRRDLGNSLGTMMRPSNIEWFHMGLEREDQEDHDARKWLEYATNVQRRAMYDRVANLSRACKESDHDIAAFGQSVKSVEINKAGNALLYRCWHIRDVAWQEDFEGKVRYVHRKWKARACDLVQMFPQVHARVAECLTGPNKEPFKEFNIRHILMPADAYDGEYPGKGLPFVSITIDVDNKQLMEVVGQAHFKYTIPRWQTVSGSQYALSPAAVTALPDARLIQEMARTLLEAGQKAVNPPLIGVEEAIRGDVPLYAGGITWVDQAYDERLGEVLRPITQDIRGLGQGHDGQERIASMIREAFFLNALTMPQNGPEMTAYEVGQRVQEYIRQASPIFEPLEDEDNGQMCDTTFELLMRNGAFGSIDDIPQSVRGKDVIFRFENPLHDAVEKQKGQIFMQATGILGQAVPLDPTVPAQVDVHTAFRDVLQSIGVPEKWLRSEDDAEKLIEQQKQQQQAQQLLAEMGQGAQVAQLTGQARQALAA